MIYCRQSTPIEWRYTEDGKHVRVSVRTGRIIPVPISNEETIDYKLPRLYQEQVKDTTKADVEKITFAVCKISESHPYFFLFVELVILNS